MTILIGLFFGCVAAFLFDLALMAWYHSTLGDRPDRVTPGFFLACGLVSLGLGYWMVMP